MPPIVEATFAVRDRNISSIQDNPSLVFLWRWLVSEASEFYMSDAFDYHYEPDMLIAINEDVPPHLQAYALKASGLIFQELIDIKGE